MLSFVVGAETPIDVGRPVTSRHGHAPGRRRFPALTATYVGGRARPFDEKESPRTGGRHIPRPIPSNVDAIAAHARFT
jgi:hypothetical protein